MKIFLHRIFAFTAILLLIFIVGICLPPTPRSQSSLLFSKQQKDQLLLQTQAPRLILVGGSNLSFGINSQLIADALPYNPVNTAFHANLGLSYMLTSVLPKVQAGDLLVVVAEYSHFFGANAYGSEELLRVVMDTSRGDLATLSFKQWLNIIKYFPKYAFSKLKPTEYMNVRVNRIYGVNSFNRFGDAVGHWTMGPRPFQPYAAITDPFNPAIVDELLEYEEAVRAKSAYLFLTFPGFGRDSFDNNRQAISLVYKALAASGLCLLGNPENYAVESSLLFNTPYHLSKAGADQRTNLLIDDLSQHIQAINTAGLNCGNSATPREQAD